MKNIISERIDRILNTGVFNQEHQNWLFEKKEALEKLNDLINNNYPVLGGEIYDNKFVLTWSWSLDRKYMESDSEYLKRTKEEALYNIENYNFFQGAKYISFTPTLL